MKNFIKKITHQAGQIILEKFGKVGVKYTKSNIADVVTEADLAANDYLVEQITQKYPEHGIISEESGESKAAAEYIWIIDPLDGTRNFATHVPIFGVIVGLAKGGEMEMGAVCDPVHNQLAFAEKGQGAFLNDKPMKCSDTKEWEQSYGFGIAALDHGRAQIYKKLIKLASQKQFWMNAFGSAAISSLCVADGRRDWKFSLGGKVWDYAAPTLIMREAGCIVSDIDGQPWTLDSKSLVAANEHLHKKLIKIIKN
ncbi:inositol monophosphatase [Patescibacteria group bacterium]|nr:inositol monophosphatase [Patescibacteria group bacterium]